MTRVAFAQRYGPGGMTLTEPWAPTGRETYYERRREWFTLCRLCGAVTAHACEVDAHRAATRTCPEPSCPPEQVELCHHCGLRKVQRHVYRGQLCYRCSRDPRIRVGYMARRPSRKELTEAEVVLMRERRAAGARQADLAAQFGVTNGLVSMIVRGLRWANAGGPIQKTNSKKAA